MRVHVGTYAQLGGHGLYPLLGSGRSDWTVGAVYEGAQNASFGTYSARHDLYYFVDEQADGAVGIFRHGAAGWEKLAHVASAGAQPCHVALDRDARMLAVANYGSGSIALFALDQATGLPLGLADVRSCVGSGPNPARQEGPHAHCVCFDRDGRWLYHVDLGRDVILAYPIEPETKVVGAPVIAFEAPAGAGPRQLVFHPELPQALLVCELASTLTVLDVGDGQLRQRQMMSTLPAAFSGESLGGHLSLNAAGTRGYVTNRGHDSIAVFAWEADGTIALRQHVASGGVSPRAFILLEAERTLLAANEEGGNVTAFDLSEDGSLSPMTAAIPLLGAVFLIAAPQAPAA